MFDNPFLDGTANNANKRQQLDHLLRITAPHERFILAGIGLVLLVLVAWALFGDIVRTVQVDGVLIKPGVRHEVVSTENGYLVEFLVVPGDRIKIGDPVARQSVPALEREIAAMRERVELLETELRQVGKTARTLRAQLDTARVALLQMEARRSARELIVSQGEGEIMALRSAPGAYLLAGDAVALVRDVKDELLQAVLGVAPRMAQRIQPGMPASVEIVTPGGATRLLNGEVASVTPGPLPNWLAALQPTVPDSTHRIDVLLHQTSDLSLPDGTPCRGRIVFGMQSAAELVALGQF